MCSSYLLNDNTKYISILGGLPEMFHEKFAYILWAVLFLNYRIQFNNKLIVIYKAASAT